VEGKLAIGHYPDRSTRCPRWVTSVVLCNGRPPVNFRYASLATECRERPEAVNEQRTFRTHRVKRQIRRFLKNLFVVQRQSQSRKALVSHSEKHSRGKNSQLSITRNIYGSLGVNLRIRRFSKTSLCFSSLPVAVWRRARNLLRSSRH
jgi:hypothetical protein